MGNAERYIPLTAERKAAEATNKALQAIVRAAASFEDDDTARDYIVSFEITDQLSDATIDALVAPRMSFGASTEPDPMVSGEVPPAFAAARLKKSLTTCGHPDPDHVCFAEPGGTVERITDQAVQAAGRHVTRRLKQMRDPDMVKLRPYWMYIHADTRVPLNPREQHVAWDGLVLMWDDPWWDIYFPPNDWRCSCGVRSLSERQLRAMGKTGPDTAPEIIREPYTHEATGVTVDLPEGTGYGWDYQPGKLWEQGLVPSQIIDEGGGLIHAGRHAVVIDQPTPLADLLAQARPFAAQPLASGLAPEDYVRAFLQPFGADIGRAVLWQDQAGARVPVSEAFFQARDGSWKIGKRGREIYTPLMAEALLDPDEIWLGVAAKQDPVRDDLEELVLDRRYIRADPDTGVMVVMEVGRRWWEAVTAYNTTDKRGRADLQLLDRRRGGKLLWKRK